LLCYYEKDLKNLLRSKFKSEMEQYKLDFKLIKLNNEDVLIVIVSTNNNKRMNSSVRDTNIIFNKTEDEKGNPITEIIICNDSFESFISKIKKTIFDICLVKWGN